MARVTTVTPNGAAIKLLRENRGLSRRQLGSITGRHQQSIRRLEATTEPASRLIVCQVANALGVDVDELILPEAESAGEEAVTKRSRSSPTAPSARPDGTEDFAAA